jgi:hypothetical protein
MPGEHWDCKRIQSQQGGCHYQMYNSENLEQQQ